MIVIAKKTMKWRGYGFVLQAGRNEIEGKLPYGLLRSLERHAKHNHIKIVEPYVDPDPPKPKRAKKEDSNETPETPAVPPAGDASGESAGSPAPSPETDAHETTDQDQLDLFFDGAEPGEGDGGSAPAADASAVVSVETQVSEQPTQPQKKRGKHRK